MFFLCRLMDRKKFFLCWLFSLIVDPSYSIRMPLLNLANHIIWQKSWSTSKVFTVFPWILEVNTSKEWKKSLSVFVLDSRTKEDDSRVTRAPTTIKKNFWKTHWSRRQTRISCQQNAFPVCCRNKQRNFTTNQASCSRNAQRRWRSSVWKC